MAKVRQARRCSATRSTDGQPCQGWAIIGGTVCAAHGGSADQVRGAALTARTRQRLDAAFRAADAALAKETRKWQARRIAAASRLLGVPVAEVHEGHVWWAAAEHPDQFPPRPEFRVDGRRLRGIPTSDDRPLRAEDFNERSCACSDPTHDGPDSRRHAIT